ncbi:MAG TPA: branched-chain amino acid ABC transporter permease [Solirubrobacteraceae bacterium]|jgi:branched-chain amino acid transport system permease protein|nr:branched-chain amino acid ABC transporter permease [Solirubrobacteraceae bacterium]
MSELKAQLQEWREAVLGRIPAAPGWLGGNWNRPGIPFLLAVLIVLPLLFSAASGFLQATIYALGYVVMALGLNVVIGFAGLLDLGYVAFYALGAYAVGWVGSDFISGANVNLLAGQTSAFGIHLNFILILVCAMIVTSIAGMIIGLPTLRLRGDYIAIVTLAFGEIIGTLVTNGSNVVIFGQPVTAGNLGISSVDAPYFPGLGTFGLLNLRPWYWLILAITVVCVFVAYRLRDSRLGRAWIALREDEVAAVSMGIPLVKTKLMAYAIGAAFGGMSGVFLASFDQTVNASQFEFSFSIFIVSMVVLGGIGSIPGAILGALLISYINYYLIPDVLNTLPHTFGLNFDLNDLSIGIYGFLLVIVMVLRPQGLWPEKRRKRELAGEVAPELTELAEPSAGGVTAG